MLTRLIYASAASAPLTPQTLQQIVDTARRGNQRLHVTGLLAFNSSHFLQVLEGDRRVLSQLFTRIAADPRHQALELMEVAPITERLFAQWDMGMAPADAEHRELFLRFGPAPHFQPAALTAAGALGLLQHMARPRKPAGRAVPQPAVAAA